MELRNLNLVKLSSREIEVTNGGNPWIRVGITIVSGAAAAIAVLNTQWNEVSQDISEGFNAGYNAAQ